MTAGFFRAANAPADEASALTSAAAAAQPAAAATARPLKVLMVCELVMLPYRVMRSTAAAGAEVYVLGSRLSRGLRYSRDCARFELASVAFDGSATAAMAAEINRCVAEYEIDLVLAGDAPSTRSLIGLKSAVTAPCFPLPGLAEFDLLNNKWEFFQLCRRLGINCPPTQVLPDRASVIDWLAANPAAPPVVAKPLTGDGGRGFVVLDGAGAREQAAQIDYAPVLVQDFIEGEDIGASIYCREGKVHAFIAHKFDRAIYSTFADQAIYDDLSRIAEETGIDGVYNFDMRRRADGRIFYLECNPRFFYKINMSMAAGINFVALGLSSNTVGGRRLVPDGTRVHFPMAVLTRLAKPWQLARRDFAMLGFLFGDPVSYLREHLGIDRD
jgi:hypothetical protein